MHHNPWITDLSFCSCKLGYMLFLKLFDAVLMKSTKIHSPLQTHPHNLTPPSLYMKLPLNLIIPIVSKFHPNLPYPIYIPLETHHQPVKRRGRRWHGHPLSPTILPLLFLTPSKTSPFIRISFSFCLSFLSSSACFLVRSGEIKMSLKFSEFENFRDPETTLHLTATDSIFKLRFLPMSAISLGP